MAGKAGKNLLLKVEDSGSPGTYTTIGGLRSKTMTLNNEAIDATNHGSNEYREILDTAGIRSMSVSGSGIFTSDANLAQIRADVIAGTLRNFQIVDTDAGDTFTAAFKIVSLERAGEYNAEQTYSISLESSGTITVS